MSAPRLQIPAELERAMRQFARDFDAVAQAWVDRHEETPDSMATARADLRTYLANPDDPDEHGVLRTDRLRHVFEFWRDLVLRTTRSTQRATGATPVLALDAEQRIADAHWMRTRRGR